MTVRIRPADPLRDAAAVAAIYRPAVVDSVASFEAEPPDAAEMGRRIAATLQRTPWLIAEVDSRDAAGGSEVVGFAYAGAHRTRAAYRWSVDVSAYVSPDHAGRGVGRALYEELLSILRRQGFVTAYAGIALPNPASRALHAAVGMRPFAVYEAVGWKAGRWVDVEWWTLRLVDPVPSTPREPVPYDDLPPR